MKISVVMAAWNEAGNVEQLANRLYNVFEKSGIDFELIYVLRGTKEHSGYNGLMELKNKGMDKIHILYRPDVTGYGPSFRTGFDAVAPDATHVLTLDADLNHQPEELPGFIESLNNTHADIIIGSRYLKGGKFEMPRWKKILSKEMNIILSILYGISIQDKTSGYRLYKKDVIQTLSHTATAKNFEYLPELLIYARKKGYAIEEIPIDFKARQIGTSKMSIIKSIIGYIRLMKKAIRK